jgi:transcriptional regulator with XRE-family HTH domain
MSALSDLLRAANASGESARAIARSAKELGYSLNHDTAARYLRGDHGRPDEQTLVALAAVLPVPLSQLRHAAGLPSEQTEPYSPPAEASRLSRRQRRAVDEIIRAMLDPGSQLGAVAGEQTPVDVAARTSIEGEQRRLRAARRGPAETGDAATP